MVQTGDVDAELVCVAEGEENRPTLDGETVVGLHNELGYVHTGIEKNMEQKSYWKAITYAPRADYNAFFCNELVYGMAVEKLLGLEVPRRGEWIRAIFTELQRTGKRVGVTSMCVGTGMGMAAVWVAEE